MKNYDVSELYRPHWPVNWERILGDIVKACEKRKYWSSVLYYGEGGVSLSRVNIKDENQMPRKTSKGNDHNASGRETKKEVDLPVSWANVYLDAEDEARIAANDITVENLSAQFLGLAIDGWSTSLKPARDGGFQATIIAPNNFAVNGQRLGISGFSGTPWDAIHSVLYKWYDKLGEQVPETKPTDQRRFR